MRKLNSILWRLLIIAVSDLWNAFDQKSKLKRMNTGENALMTQNQKDPKECQLGKIFA